MAENESIDGATQALHMLRAELEDERAARWRLQAARDAQLERAEKAEADWRTERAARERAEKRIEELTAELAEAMRSGEVVAGLLATERAARDRAGVRIEELTAELERELADHCWEDCGCREAAAKAIATTNAHLEQAERERDEHAKHRANLDRKNQELSRENERLVDYAIGCQRERETALERVEELEAQLSKADKTTLEQAVSRLAAESALASARAAIDAAVSELGQMVGNLNYPSYVLGVPRSAHAVLKAWLTSHSTPVAAAPVAAPCADDPCHHCGKQLRYSHTVAPQFPGGGMKLESRPVYRCDDGHEFERLEVRK